MALTALFFYNVSQRHILPDDAYISFRYADNLVRGEGLVWNPGERVEGYTNFLWVLLTAGGLRLGLDPVWVSYALNTASGVAVIVALFLLSGRTHGPRRPLTWLLPIVFATSPSFTAWCRSGLSAMFFTTLVFFGYLAFLREREQRPTWPVLSPLLFALASLTRPEGALFFGIAGLFVLVDLVRRQCSLRSALLWGLPYVAIVGTHVLWRHAYYGFWLPNTFYAKVNGMWWERGLQYYKAFAETYHLQWFLPLALLSVLWRPRFVNVLFLTVAVVYGTYVASVGGDFMEFRFLLVIFPYVYWLIGDGIDRLTRIDSGTVPRWAGRVAAAGCAGALVVTTAIGSVGDSLDDFVRLGVASPTFLNFHTDRLSEQGRFLRELIDEGLLPGDTVIGLRAAGALPYFSRLPTIDRFGLNDVQIAHQPLDQRGRLPGHERSASPEYLRERGVVILDAIEDIVHDQPFYDRDANPLNKYKPAWERDLPLRVVKAKDHYLIFATMVPEEEFRRVFRNLEIVQ